jgi:glucosylceramidase
LTAVTSGNADMTVNDTMTYQTISGFGGALNEKGWDNLNQLGASDKAKALTLLFDPNSGANFQYGRIPIGANDYAITSYSEDDTSNDASLTHFSIAEDQKYIIPYVQAVLAINPNIHLWASPWSPPGWMKTGADTTANTLGLNGGTMKSDTATLTTYANYFVMWLQAYSAAKINIEAVVPQNEPNYAQHYPSCLWPTQLYDTFVATYLGPTFAKQNISAKIILGTMSNDGNYPSSVTADAAIVAAVTGDSTAMKYIQGFGFQWTMLDQSKDVLVSKVTSYNLPVWQTEHKAGNYPWGNLSYEPAFNSKQAPNDYTYGMETWGLIRDWLKAGVNLYSAWNLVLDTIGLGNDTQRIWPQNSLLVVDRNAKTLIITPTYYVFRHFSQYVQPGATRVGVSGTKLDALAFKNTDGSIVTVLYNTSPVLNGGTGSGMPVTTTLAVGGQQLQFTVPANGFATVVVPK